MVCRQLGYEGALAVLRNSPFGHGSGQIWLGDVQCIGNETSILQCSQIGWGVHNGYCWGSDDAGVVCRPSGKRTMLVNIT